MSKWSELDWQEYFNERAGVYQFDGGFTQPVAEQKALEDMHAEQRRREDEYDD